MKVSIIIPIYNSGFFLHECLDSVQGQTLKDIEIICINDGSTDDSQKIIKNYQKNDARFILINQKNKGVSEARNRGLETAKGEYIGFVDADDYIENNMFEKLYSSAKGRDVDIVISNYYQEYDGVEIKRKSFFQTNTIHNKTFIQKEIIPFLVKNDTMSSCWNKLYNARLVHAYNFRFPIGVSHGEDGLFNTQIFNKANSVFFIKYSGYHYREVSSSASRGILDKDFFQIAQNKFNSDYPFELAINYKEIKRLKSIRFFNTITSLIYIYLKPNKDESFSKRYQYIKKMINNKQVQKTVRDYWKDLIKDRNKYFIFILKSIKAKSVIALLLATNYSYFRNKK